MVGALCVLGLVGTSTASTQPAPANAAAARPPVVMIVMDAFPTVSLLNARSRIDRVRYPNFARLAADSTWFPYATTSLDETGRAFREIFTSRTSWRFAKPTYAKHPNNLFTLLGRRYRIEAGEEGNELLPEAALPERAAPDQGVDRSASWRRAGRSGSWRWVERFSPSPTPDVLLQARAVSAFALGLPAVGAHLLRRAERKRRDLGPLGLDPVARPAEVPATPAAGRVHRSPARARA